MVYVRGGVVESRRATKKLELFNYEIATILIALREYGKEGCVFTKALIKKIEQETGQELPREQCNDDYVKEVKA